MSGIYIPGMEMPTSCGDCKAFVCYRQWAGDAGDCFCGITKNDAKEKEKNADCPLVPVPEHGRLIDADALIDDMANMIPWAIESPEEIAMVDGLSAGYEAVKAAPTIIPADPVGKEGEG